jgi:hypothetical protein
LIQMKRGHSGHLRGSGAGTNNRDIDYSSADLD